jgi:ABC-type polysaccharide/polyol phosphate transport system ATPase subunit
MTFYTDDYFYSAIAQKDFGIKELLTDASFSLDEEDKVGLIGTNGSGKSTLLKMIAGMESIDSGDRSVNIADCVLSSLRNAILSMLPLYCRTF